MTEAKIIARKEGRAGRLTFNRPKALNAIDHEMALVIDRALADWRDDPEVAVVVIDALGERAFCAGGDVAAVYRAAAAGDYASGAAFFRDEYRMNARIREYPKPIVAFMQGFVMGGGVGVGGHAGLRIVGETTRVAMPETGIGLVPDVGGTLILALAPGRVGECLAMTGETINAADAIYAGFADRFLPEALWPDAKARLIATGDPATLPAGEAPPTPGRLAAEQAVIDAVFSAPALTEVLSRLAAIDSPFARETLDVLNRKSPLAEEAALRMVRLTRARPTIRDALSNELRFTLRAAELADFMEGVRAQLIDKDRTPHWGWRADALPEDRLQALLAPVPEDCRINFA